MYNWSVNLKKLGKSKRQFQIWRLEQLINFGLGNEKIKKTELKDNFKSLTIDPQKRKYLEFILSS